MLSNNIEHNGLVNPQMKEQTLNKENCDGNVITTKSEFMDSLKDDPFFGPLSKICSEHGLLKVI